MRKNFVVTLILAISLILLSTNMSISPTPLSMEEYSESIISDYVVHAPITIASDSDFETQAWPGNGTSGNPYLIEGLSITADAVCISIADVTAYFEIRVCLVSSGVPSSHHGIDIQNVTHGTIRDCIVDLHSIGIRLRDSNDCILTNNTATSNTYDGFYFYNCSGCVITNNTAANNTYDGFYIQNSNNCTLSGNTLVNNGLHIYGGIVSDWFHNISNNTVNSKPLGYFVNLTSMIIDGTQFGQVILVNCSEVMVEDGVFTDTSIGIQMGFCTDCTLTNNTATSNYRIGFSLYYSSNCTLTNNTATSNSVGFYIGISSNCTLTNNIAISNSEGFYLYSSSNCTLTNNTASSNYDGFYLVSSTDCSLTNNTVINSSARGLYINNSHSCTLTKNTVTDTSSGTGFYLSDSESCTLDQNTATNSGSSGFSLWSSGWSTLTNNIAINNSNHGFNFRFSNNSTLTNNTATSNSNDGFSLSSASSTLTGNLATNNTYYGFYLFSQSDSCILTNNTATSNIGGGFRLDSNSCTMTQNTAANNSQYGIYIQGSNGLFYQNRLGDNGISNARDDGSSNSWDDGVSLGNYWSDYRGSGTYVIPGSAGSVDHYPSVWGVPEPISEPPILVIVGIIFMVLLIVFAYLGNRYRIQPSGIPLRYRSPTVNWILFFFRLVLILIPSLLVFNFLVSLSPELPTELGTSLYSTVIGLFALGTFLMVLSEALNDEIGYSFAVGFVFFILGLGYFFFATEGSDMGLLAVFYFLPGLLVTGFTVLGVKLLLIGVQSIGQLSRGILGGALINLIRSFVHQLVKLFTFVRKSLPTRGEYRDDIVYPDSSESWSPDKVREYQTRQILSPQVDPDASPLSEDNEADIQYELEEELERREQLEELEKELELQVPYSQKIKPSDIVQTQSHIDSHSSSESLPDSPQTEFHETRITSPEIVSLLGGDTSEIDEARTGEISIHSGVDSVGENLKIAVKVTNESKLAIIGVTVTLDAPEALEFVRGSSATVRLGSISAGGFQSAIFWLRVLRCIDDFYGGTIVYRGAAGQTYTRDIPRKQLVNICPMLKETDSPKDVFVACKYGGLKRNSTSFKFRGLPSVVFSVAVSRISALVPVDKTEENLGKDKYLGYTCVVGETKYSGAMFGAEIQVSGDSSGGVLTLTVYSDDERILSGFFVDIMSDVRTHVDVLEENNMVKPTACPNCGAPLDLSNLDETRIYECNSCKSRGKVPPWMV